MIWRAYAIACTPRVGGNWLDALLTDAGLGGPEETLHRLHDEGRCHPAAMREAWAERGRNGIFGTKVSWAEANYGVDFATELLPADAAQLWVYLHRRDLDAQALSLAVARKYGTWYERRPLGAVVKDDEVTAARDHLDDLQRGWAQYFLRTDIQPLAIAYEDLCADPVGTVATITSTLYALPVS